MEKKPKASPRARATASPAKKSTTTKSTAAPRKRTVTAKAAAAPAGKSIVRATGSAPASPSFAPSHGQIAAFAYSLFEQSGHQHGRALEHWLEAESRLKQGLKL